MAKDIKKETPLMKQYRDIKSKYPDSVLLFRVGDFYETFHEDAIIASKVLGIIDREWVALKLNELFVIEFYSRKI